MGGIDELLRAYDSRPNWPDSLYELSKRYRSEGMHDAALLFAMRGLNLSLCETAQEWRWKFMGEIATSGWHSWRPDMREMGHEMSERLALDRDFWGGPRERVWRNLFYYTKKLPDYAPSFSKTRIGFDVPDGFWPTNPSICNVGSGMAAVVRCVNYRIGPEPKPVPTCTRNFLLLIDQDVSRQHLVGEIFEPAQYPIRNHYVLGIEDMRIWRIADDVYFSATSRQQNKEGLPEIITGKFSLSGTRVIHEWEVLKPPIYDIGKVQKNWMPFTDGRNQWIYSMDPVVLYSSGHDYCMTCPNISVHNWKGSSQIIPFRMDLEDGYLAMVHERPSDLDPVLGKPPYRQRFVWFDKQIRLKKISWGFEFGHESAGEYVCGMCMHPDEKRLVISYGVLDREAWLATVDADEIRGLLRDV